MPAAPQPVLHEGLVAKQLGGLGVGAGHLEVRPGEGELDLQGLEHAHDPRGLAVAPADLVDRGDELAGGEAIFDVDEVGEEAPVLTPGGLLHDAHEADAGEASRRPGEAKGGLEREGCGENDGAHAHRNLARRCRTL
jgi:hypothetical protein